MQLEVSPLDWNVCSGRSDSGADTINCWCQLKCNTTILIRIEDFPTHYYWKLDESYDWDTKACKDAYNSLKKCLRDNSKHLLSFVEEDLQYKTVLYYASKPVSMLRFKFSTRDSARHASNILKKGLFIGQDKIEGECINNDIDYVRQLLTEVGITHCSWFTCTAKVVPAKSKISILDQEYIVSYRSIKPSECAIVPRPMFCAYDIEEYCHNHNAFPDAWCFKDTINVMSVAFYRDGTNPKDAIVYVIVVCDCIVEDNDDAKIIIVDSTMALVHEFANLVKKHNPDFFTGYNILQFDNKHLNAKIGIYGEEWPNLGRLMGKAEKIANIAWSSSAYKSKDMYIPYAPGRPFLDFFEHCTRTFTWPVYSLDYACKNILAKFPDLRKKDMPAKEQFRIYKAILDTDHLPRDDPDRIVALKDMGQFVIYCKFDSTLILHMAHATNWWIGVREMCNAVGVGPQDLLTKGQQVRVLSLLYDACTKMDIVLNKRQQELFYYEGGLVQEPLKGLNRLVFTLDFKSLYPSVMITYNLCHTTLIHEKDWHKYKPEQYTSAVTYVGDQDPDEDTDVESKKKKAGDILWEEKEFRFLKTTEKQGVVPKILSRLLSERARVRKIKTDNEELKVVYDQRQLALKVCSNSVYGFMGVKNGGKRPCLEISATTTFFGRDRITYTIKWIIANCHRLVLEYYEAKGIKPIRGWIYQAVLCYGDTDSCMMNIEGVTLEHIHALAHYIAGKATEQHSHLGPLELEMENVTDILCIKQKHYAKLMYYDPAWGKKDIYECVNGVPELCIKGLTPVRRDSCDLVKKTIYDILHACMFDKSYSEVVGILLRTVRDLYRSKVDIGDLVITKGLGAHYKSATATMKVFAEQMAKQGQTINAGERHEFIVVNVPGQDKVGMKMTLLSLYMSLEPSKRPKIDSKYYFKNLLMKKVDVITDACFGKYAKQVNSFSAMVNGRKVTGLSPGRMLQGTIEARQCEPFLLMAKGSKLVDQYIQQHKEKKAITLPQ
jgi:DNA polymerase delta subunit 1